MGDRHARDCRVWRRGAYQFLGRVVGSATIIVGVTFLSFLTAIVTSLFISIEEEEKAVAERELRAASEAETRSLLLRLDERLAAIDAKLDRR